MIYRDFQYKKLPLLGFGCMRLPRIPEGTAGDIDENKTFELISKAIASGVNYFDTAYFYHQGQSENVMGKILSRFPRESFFLADKYPGNMTADEYTPEKTFSEQLEKCKVDYFDFYLLHNVSEKNIDIYTDPKWGIIDYFVEQKKKGRIRHLGFSSHGNLPMLEDFLNRYGEHMEFCQIQLNYLDWTLQDAKAKVELLNRKNIPIWVMEPVRGGRIASLSEENMALLTPFHPERTAVEWAFRFVQEIPGVKMVLSGMSNLQQLEKNIETFREEKPLTQEEREALFAIAENLKHTIPCTGCAYCTEDCPKGLDIPTLITVFNSLQHTKTMGSVKAIRDFDDEKVPEACISCGLCENTCPQKIAVPEVMKKLSETLAGMSSWVKYREERKQNKLENQ